MVICEELRLAFLHIPKCAGTTVRRGLAPFDSYRFDGYFDFPEGGRQHLHHLPLAVLKRHFPALYGKIESYESYAVLREPRERFASALLQYLRSFQKQPLSRCDVGLFQQKGRALCGRLMQSEPVRVPELMHFLPQRDFVVCDGMAVVRHLYSLQTLAVMARDLERRHGVLLDFHIPANQARTRNSQTLQLLVQMTRPALARVVAPASRQWLRGSLRGLTGNAPAKLYAGLYEDREVGNFVDHYYAADAELYRRLAVQ